MICEMGILSGLNFVLIWIDCWDMVFVICELFNILRCIMFLGMFGMDWLIFRMVLDLLLVWLMVGDGGVIMFCCLFGNGLRGCFGVVVIKRNRILSLILIG